MKSEEQLKVQAYLDNELSASEARKVGDWISSTPEARELYNELKETRQLISGNEMELKLPETREFYWSKIERGIAAAERVPASAPARSWWLRLFAPVAGSVALFALLFTVMDRGGNSPLLTQAGEVTPLHQFEGTPDVSTITFRSEAEGVTVVWLSTQ